MHALLKVYSVYANVYVVVRGSGIWHALLRSTEYAFTAEGGRRSRTSPAILCKMRVLLLGAQHTLQTNSFRCLGAAAKVLASHCRLGHISIEYLSSKHAPATAKREPYQLRNSFSNHRRQLSRSRSTYRCRASAGDECKSNEDNGPRKVCWRVDSLAIGGKEIGESWDWVISSKFSYSGIEQQRNQTFSV